MESLAVLITIFRGERKWGQHPPRVQADDHLHFINLRPFGDRITLCHCFSQGADRSSRMSRPAKPSSKIGGVALRGDTPGASEQDRFVHRDGMFGLARELRLV